MTFGFFRKKKDISLGAYGEAAAADFLHDSGYRILARNVCNEKGRRIGEIDIVAEKGETVVFVEVKTREMSLGKKEFFLPESNISREKLRKLARIGEWYMKRENLLGRPYRFDAISVRYFPLEKRFSCEHIQDIFF